MSLALALLMAAPASHGQDEVRGLVVAVQRATLSAELAARIIELPYREGERFERGATLYALDCRRTEAQRAAAAAELRGARKTWATNRELAALNSIGALELDVSRAEVDRTRANLAALDTDVGHCKVDAPFAGRVVESHARVHERVTRGDPVLAILDDANLEIELLVPARWLRWLRVDDAFEFAVDETGTRHSGRVVRIGAAIDPESQTVKVFGAFGGGAGPAPAGVLSGMSGGARFEAGR